MHSASIDERSHTCEGDSLPMTSETASLKTGNEASGPAIGPSLDVESALAFAISEAARAARWDVVSQLARELEARRLASTPNVVPLERGRSR